MPNATVVLFPCFRWSLIRFAICHADHQKATARFNAEKAVMQRRQEQSDLRHQLEQQDKEEDYQYHLEQMAAL